MKKHEQEKHEKSFEQIEPTFVDTNVQTQDKTQQRRSQQLNHFEKYVTDETGGQSISEIKRLESGTEILLELFFTSSCRLRDGKTPSKNTLEHMKSSLEMSLIEEHKINEAISTFIPEVNLRWTKLLGDL